MGAAASLPRDHGGLLVVDDEPFLRDAVAASLRFLGFEVTTAETGTGALRLARDRPFDLRRAGRDAARRRRLRGGAPAARRRQPGAGDLPDRPGHPGRQGDRADPRRRRLPDQAVRAGGTGGQDPHRAAPHPPRRRGRGPGAHLRRHRARPGQLRGPPGRPPGRPVADRVPAAALPDAQPRPGADPGADAGPRVGLRLRRLQHRRLDLRRLPAAQAGPARAGRDPYPARHRLQPAPASPR